MEKRNFTRIIFHTEAAVVSGDLRIKGEVENLSMNGMLLRTPDRIPVSANAQIRIVLSGASPEISVEAKGHTLRHESDGIAFQFDEMDLDSFIHLKNIIAYNRGDDGDVAEEFEGLIHRKKQS
ncbi:MAG: PilZ domain-containing protein [Syntrophobacteraceae bacterium]|nr:PilZ domain-containing protein [Desulfobacteraceae bacterium]